MMVRLNGGGHYDLIPFPDEREAIDIGDYYGDFAKIDKVLGWQPRISLEDGLTRALEYYRRHRQHYW